MRILILGAGATGGYFGGRLAKAGVDVTFLVRPRRREQLIRDGLKIESPTGDVATPVTAVTRDEIAGAFDVIILSAKAYDLTTAIEAIRPAVGEATLVLPLLNGLRHLDDLDAVFESGACSAAHATSASCSRMTAGYVSWAHLHR